MTIGGQPKELQLGQHSESTGLKWDEEDFFDEERQFFRANKLFDARSLNGEKNEELFTVVRDIESRLANIREFIGLSPFGSQTKGYSTDESDFDMYILLDSSTYDLPELNKILTAIQEEYKQKGETVSFVKELITGTDIGTPTATIAESTMESIESIAALSRVTTGKKVEMYRTLVKEKVGKMYPLKKTAFFANVIKYLADRDGNSRTLAIMEKRADEMGKAHEFDDEAYKKAHEELWTKRVHTIFGEG